jgi:NodT family efflux transporter outer membrane factor (OMF) lipoprotein
MSVRRAAGALLGALLLAACAVGPDFHRPAPPAVQQYGAPLAQSTAPTAGGEPQQLEIGASVPERWWEAFGSGQIDALVEQVLAANPDIQAGQAALRAALESAAAARGALWPGLQASYQGVRRRDATGTLSPTLNSGAPIFTLHTAEVDVSYTLDVFGGNRRTVEALVSTAEAQRFGLEATRLTLASNAIVAVVNQAAAQAQIAAMQHIVQEERAALETLRQQYALGSVSLATVNAQEATLSQAEAALPALEQQRVQQQDLIAALAGRAPSQMTSLDVELSALTLPRNVPLTLPAQLVTHRPDIRAAEAQLHAATAQVGVAEAALLPAISLSANSGSAAVQLSNLTAPGTRFWSLGGSLSQTLFAGGSLVHRKRAAVALMDQAADSYRSTVLQAFRQVADVLAALQSDAATLAAQTRAESAAAQSLNLVVQNLKLGSASGLELIQAEHEHEMAVLALVQARAARLADTVALYQALGGGWAVTPAAAR